ncbi:MAG: class I SAM-dependent methyltransferase, partial [Saprospiraceae bacterium]
MSLLAKNKLYRYLSRVRSRRIAKNICQLIPARSKILDFGCGNMYTAIELKKIDPSLDITGIDVIEDQNLDIQSQHLNNVKFSLTYPLRINAEDSSYDIALAIASLHHTSDPEKMLKKLLNTIN